MAHGSIPSFKAADLVIELSSTPKTKDDPIFGTVFTDHMLTVEWSAKEELATPPLDGIILPGVNRQSILELTRKWGEFKVTARYLTMSQLCSALKHLRVKEKLHIPCPDKDSQLASRIAKELIDIQHGRTSSDWTFLV